jgi:hypothetical protein
VDPIISNPANSQSINPYSYIGNNPLSGVDPTGYMAGSICGIGDKCTVNGLDKDVTGTNAGPGPLMKDAAPKGNGTPGLQAKQGCQDPASCGAPKETGQQTAEPSAAKKSTLVNDLKLGGTLLLGGLKGYIPGFGLLPMPKFGDPDLLAAAALGELVGAGLAAGQAAGAGASGGGLLAASPGTSGGTLVPGLVLEAVAVVQAASVPFALADAKASFDRAMEMRGSGNGGGGGDSEPRLVSNPKHHPGSASPEPRNAGELFKSSIADGKGVRWARDANGDIHRFSAPSNREVHWNGSTAGPNPIRMENVPSEVRRALAR